MGARVEAEKKKRLDAIKQLQTQESRLEQDVTNLGVQKKKDTDQLTDEKNKVESLEKQAKEGVLVMKTIEKSLANDNAQIKARSSQETSVVKEIAKLQS